MEQNLHDNAHQEHRRQRVGAPAGSRALTRRISFGAAAVFASVAIRPMPRGSQLGDEQWRRLFEQLLAKLNRYMMELNESRLYARPWQKVWQAGNEVVNAS